MSGLRRAIPVLVLVACAAAMVPLRTWTDHVSAEDASDDVEIYVTNGERVKLMALGYDSLLADVYWMRAIQFFGRRVLADKTVLDDPRGRLDELYPLIDVSTTLDPRSIKPYRFGAFFVHDYVDAQRGREILSKGIRANPDSWRLYQDLAFLYWSDGDCDTASRLYAEGGAVAGAPMWMREMAAIIPTMCGRPDVTVELLRRQYDSTDDPRIREQLAKLATEYEALVEVLALEDAVVASREREGRNPKSLAALVRDLATRQNAPRLRVDRDGNPLDPNGAPYRYDASSGSVTTDPSSVKLPAAGRSRPGAAQR
jgi:hypothetical protein